MISLRQYLAYIAVAAVAFVVTVAAREVFAALLPADTVFYYVVSMVLAYAVGIVVNFSLQHTLTFRRSGRSKSLPMFGGFILVAVAGGGVTAATATIVRYVGDIDRWFGVWGGSVAFVIGNVVGSLLTYWLNARWVFAPVGRPADR